MVFKQYRMSTCSPKIYEKLCVRSYVACFLCILYHLIFKAMIRNQNNSYLTDEHSETQKS